MIRDLVVSLSFYNRRRRRFALNPLFFESLLFDEGEGGGERTEQVTK